MSDIVIKVENLSKRYTIGSGDSAGYKTIRETIVDAFNAPFHRIGKLFKSSQRSTVNGKQTSEDNIFWALKDVSFEVNRGEVVGIIGGNGAGKSTLLKILSKITEPTTGRVELKGRVGSLLEVGTGFHPELTGHENVYLYGAILGMDRWEISRKFDEIIDFAELEKFIDTPVKRYSSGMYMRLAFAVAAHLEPEILLVDEVLAVGDMLFQKKCLGKMENVSKEGRTVIFVSHNMGAIKRTCNISFLIDHGNIIYKSNPQDTISKYQSMYLTHSSEWINHAKSDKDNLVTLRAIKIKNDKQIITSSFSGDEEITFEIEYQVKRHVSGCQIAVRICNSEGTAILTTADSDNTGMSAVPRNEGLYRTISKLPRNLLVPGTYAIIIAAHLPNRQIYHLVEQPVTFEISQSGSLSSLDGRLGMVSPLVHWETSKIE
ncbi:ABC transporter ATP-binding protein [Thermodesulfobacteriota bacterium]